MTKTLGALADELLETIAKEDEEYFQRHGFYTTRTRAGECKVLCFDWPQEQKKLDDFEIWRNNQMITGVNGIYRDEKATEINKMLKNTIERLEDELNYLDERRMELTLDPIEEREKEFSEILKNVGDLSELEIDLNLHNYISDIVGELRNILYRDYEEVPLKVIDDSLTPKRTRMDRESAQIWLGTTVKPLILQGITIQKEIANRLKSPANTISQRVKLSYKKEWSEYVELVQQGIL